MLVESMTFWPPFEIIVAILTAFLAAVYWRQWIFAGIFFSFILGVGVGSGWRLNGSFAVPILVSPEFSLNIERGGVTTQSNPVVKPNF